VPAVVLKVAIGLLGDAIVQQQIPIIIQRTPD